MDPNRHGGDAEGGALDFERADLGESVPVCAHCGVPIGDEYYTLGDAVHCPRCHDGVQQLLATGPGLLGWLRAVGFGLAAATGGAVLWAVVTQVSGYEIGIIAIAVGWLVGVAVRAGSGGRGGVAFQALAIVLTYLAIVTTYVPMILDAWQATPVEDLLGEERVPAAPEPADEESFVDVTAVPGQGDARSQDTLPTNEAGELEIDAGIVAAAFLMALMLPFMLGFQNAIGLLIIGIALFEAWRRSRRVQIEAAGPFRVGSQTTA